MLVSKIIGSASFSGLINYVMGPDKGVGPGQFQAHNIIDAGRAPQKMQLIASRNTRASNPASHIIVTWAKDEPVTIPRQLEVGRRLLAALDLKGHQALCVPHYEPKNGIVPGPDGRHFEMHIIINRIHPDGRANRMSHSYRRAETAIYRIANEMGFATVPGRFNSIDVEGAGIERPGLGAKIGSIKGQTGRATLADELRDSPGAMDLLRTARKDNWVSLLRAFAAQGIVIARPSADTNAARARARYSAKRVKERGPEFALKRGLVMMDAADPSRHIKLSALDSAYEKWGETALVKQLGPVPDAMLTAAAADARAKAAAKPAQQAPGHQTELGANPVSYREFAIAQQNAKRALAEQIAADRVKRSDIYNAAKREREAALSIAQVRRTLVGALFGRRSIAAAAVNALLDQPLDLKLAAIRDRRTAALATLNEATAKERVKVPRWAEWKRAHSNPRPSADDRDASPWAKPFRQVLERPIRANPAFNRPVFGPGPKLKIYRSPLPSSDFRHRARTPSR
jgi:hypothetical protein